MLKKTIIASLSMAMSGYASAKMDNDTFKPNCGSPIITRSCEAYVWDIAIDALYLKPVYSAPKAFQTAITGNIKVVQPRWGWGYDIKTGFELPTNQHVALNWLHYDISSHLGLLGGAYLQLLPAPLVPVVLPSAYNQVLSNQFDQVNLTFGQPIMLSAKNAAEFYAGMQYALIRLDGRRFYAIPPIFIAATSGVLGTDNTDFSGAGPIIGLDYSYNVATGLRLTANASSALLYGTTRYDASTAYGNGLVVSSLYNSQRQIVPSFEGKLGASYSHSLANGLVNIQGGYQVVNYFSALPSIQHNSVHLTNGDFSLYGPYVGLKWMGIA